jgi:hypothetical protein
MAPRAFEMAGLAGVVLLAAALRLANLPARGGWDADQGTEMLALRSALQNHQLLTFGPLASIGTFHHGGLSRDLWLPAAWLGNGDPTFILVQTAILGVLVVVLVWWISRTIGGSVAGFVAGLLAAVSASLIGYSTFLWNPTLIEPGAAVAYAAAWQAWRTGQGRWWLVAAAGGAVAFQSHVTAAVVFVPLVAVFGACVRRAPAGERRRVLAWGLAGIGLVILTFVPLFVYELGHGFAETRGMLGYLSGSGEAAQHDPLTAMFVATIRILAWPLTRWPLVDLLPAFLPALVVAVSLAIGLLWRVVATRAHGPRAAQTADESVAGPGSLSGSGLLPARPDSGEAGVDETAVERAGVRFVGGALALLVLTLGLGLHAASEVQALPTEQYHVVADPLVVVGAGLVIAGLWRAVPRQGPAWLGRAAAAMAMILLIAWNVAHWPLWTAYDGGWPAAQQAATRLERDAGGNPIALVALFEAKGSNAYGYPLLRDGATLIAPDGASTVVLLCDTFWLSGCGGAAEQGWCLTNAAGSGLILVDRFWAAPDRLMSVYRRSP